MKLRTLSISLLVVFLIAWGILAFTRPTTNPQSKERTGYVSGEDPNESGESVQAPKGNPRTAQQDEPAPTDSKYNTLISELLDAKHGRREEILLEIARKRDAFLPVLRGLLKDGNDNEKTLAISLLTKARDPESPSIFTEMLDDEGPSIQAKLMAALRILNYTNAATSIRGVMNSTADENVLSAGALALAILGGDSDIFVGRELVIGNFPPYVQFSGAFLAAMHGDPEMRQQAISFLQFDDSMAQLYAVTMLPFMRGEDVEEAMAFAFSEKISRWPSRTEGALLQMRLDGLRIEEQAEILYSACRDNDDIVAKKAVELLLELDSKRSREILTRIISDQVSEIAREARFLTLLRYGEEI